jgi:HlyD family secretion protein
MNQNIYRKEALSRLASPEQLDQLMPLTNPRGWTALSTAALLLAVALLWTIFGTVSFTVEGQGVLVRRGGLHRVAADDGGVVSDIVVHPGDEVQPMQKLLHLAPASGDDRPRPIVSTVHGRVLEVTVQDGDVVQ